MWRCLTRGNISQLHFTRESAEGLPRGVCINCTTTTIDHSPPTTKVCEKECNLLVIACTIISLECNNASPPSGCILPTGRLLLYFLMKSKRLKPNKSSVREALNPIESGPTTFPKVRIDCLDPGLSFENIVHLRKEF